MGGDTKGRRTVRFRSLSDDDDDFYDEKDDELLAEIADESNMIFDMARELIEGIIDKCCEKYDKDELHDYIESSTQNNAALLPRL